MEHDAAISALVWFAPVVITALFALELAAGKGLTPAVRLRARLLALDTSRRLALLLLAITGLIHAALIPAHVGEPVTAALFALFTSGAIAAIAGALLGVRGWTMLAVLLLGGAVLAYGAYLLLGLEQADGVGIATKIVEMAAVGLLLAPRRHVSGSGTRGRSRLGMRSDALSVSSGEIGSESGVRCGGDSG